MQAFSTAFENFIFKTPNLWGRASPSEFWLIMPLIWGGLVAFLVMDLNQIWADLRLLKVPSLNPFDYGFVLLFIITWPSRITLTMRRLHDSGRSGRWAFVPYQAAVLSIWLVLGLMVATVTTSPNAGLALGATFGIGAFAVLANGFWPLMFTIAERVSLWDILDTLRRGIATVFGQIEMPDPIVLSQSYSSDYGLDPAGGAVMSMVFFLLVFGPFILVGLWLLFLVLPGQTASNKFGEPSTPAQGISTRGRPGQHNPYAGYAVLSEQHKKKAADPEMRKAEVAALYRHRVLGKG